MPLIFLAELLVAIVCGVVAILLFRKVPRVAATVFGAGLVFGLAFVAELILSLLSFGPPIERNYPRGYYAIDDGVQEGAPGRHPVSATFTKTGEAYYELDYDIDDFGRRRTPVSDGERDYYAVLLGGSFTFGEGVDADQSIAAHFARLAPAYNVYNYGFHGLGPFDVLRRVETLDASEIQGSRGVFVYTFIDHHLYRVVDFLTGARYRGQKCAYRETKDGGLEYCGTWKRCNPLRHRILVELSKSRVLRLTGLNVPLRVGDREMRLAALTVEQMSRTIAERFSNARFYLAIYPGHHQSREMAKRITDASVTIIDLSDLFPGLEPPHVLSKFDLHPTGDAYATYTKALVDAIKQ